MSSRPVTVRNIVKSAQPTSVRVRDVELRHRCPPARLGGFTQCRISQEPHDSADVAQCTETPAAGTQIAFLYGIEQSGEGEAREM